MKWFQIIISAVTTFVIIAGGALGTAIVALKGQNPDKTVWLLCSLLGAIAAAKEVRAMCSLPPLSNGNYSAIADLLQKKEPPS